MKKPQGSIVLTIKNFYITLFIKIDIYSFTDPFSSGTMKPPPRAKDKLLLP